MRWWVAVSSDNSTLILTLLTSIKSKERARGVCVRVSGSQPRIVIWLLACRIIKRKRERLTPNYRPDHDRGGGNSDFSGAAALAWVRPPNRFPINYGYIRRRTCGSCAFQVAFTLLIMIGFFRIINSRLAAAAPSARWRMALVSAYGVSARI